MLKEISRCKKSKCLATDSMQVGGTDMNPRLYMTDEGLVLATTAYEPSDGVDCSTPYTEESQVKPSMDLVKELDLDPEYLREYLRDLKA